MKAIEQQRQQIARLQRFVARFLLSTALVVVCAVRLTYAVELTAAQQRDVLIEAQHAYDQGIATLKKDPSQAKEFFRDAAARFQMVADSGITSGELLYDLGNAYLQSGDLGQAILNYRRAERQMPGDARLQSNLQYARSLCRSQIPASAEHDLLNAILAWHFQTPAGWRFAAFTTVHAALWLLLTWQLFRPVTGGRWLIAIVAIAWVALGASIAADVTGFGHQAEGVLIADEVVMRKGNGEGFEPKFDKPIHSGVEFTIVDRRGDWLEVQLANGEKGWVPASTAHLIN